MILPLVTTFPPPYEHWTTRTATHAEMMAEYQTTGKMVPFVNDQLIARVTTPLEAANYIANVGADGGLGNHINSVLDSDANYATWRRSMPSSTPIELSKYKKQYPHCNFDQVSDEINSVGLPISPGQFLFHAGIWPGGQFLSTDRPLSTSFCPQVALRNAEHKGKAYDANRIDLFVVRATASSTKAFAYKRKRIHLGHENEVVFASGANLRLNRSTLIRNNYSVWKSNSPQKQVPIYVLEIDLL